jgi:hypothetical protein
MPVQSYYDAIDLVLDAAEQESEAAYGDWMSKSETAIAECMEDAGFTYYPLDEESGPALEELLPDPVSGVDLDVPWLPATLEETQRFGYGITPVDGLTTAEVSRSEAQAKNDEYRASLPAGDGNEYDLSLTGYGTGADLGYREDNCTAKAEKAFPVPAVNTPDVPTDVLLGVIAVVEIQRPEDGGGEDSGAWLTPGEPDPDNIWLNGPLKELNAEYAECVTANDRWVWEDWPATDPLSLFEAASRMGVNGVIRDASDPDSDPFAAVDQDPDRLVGSGPEIEVAVVDFQCRERTDYVQRFAQIQFDAEVRWVDGHRSGLDAMIAAVEALKE